MRANGSEWLDGKFRYMFSYKRNCQNFSNIGRLLWVPVSIPLPVFVEALFYASTVFEYILSHCALLPFVIHCKNCCFFLIIHTRSIESVQDILSVLLSCQSFIFFNGHMGWTEKVAISTIFCQEKIFCKY